MSRATVCAFFTFALASPVVAQQEKLDPQSFVPADAPVVVSLRPAALLKLKDVKSLYDDFTRSDEVKRVVDVAEPESVEEIRFVLLRRLAKLEGDPHEALARDAVVIVRTNKPREWKALAAAAQVPVTKTTHGAREYYRMSGEGPIGFGFLQLDEKSVVIGSEANLKQIIDTNKSAGVLPVISAPGGGALVVATANVDFAWVRGLLAPAIESEQQMGLVLSVIKPIWEKTDRLSVRLFASDAEGFTLVADHLCADEDGAKSVEKTAEAILTLARNVAPEAMKALRREGNGNPAAGEVADLAEQALNSASIEREGNRVNLKVTVKADVAKLIRIMGVR